MDGLCLHLDLVYLITATLCTHTIFAFCSVSRINQTWYNEKPQKHFKDQWSLCDCLWWSCVVTMCAKCFLEKAWFDLHSFPFVFCILVLSTMPAFYCIMIDFPSTKFALCCFIWLHLLFITYKISMMLCVFVCFWKLFVILKIKFIPTFQTKDPCKSVFDWTSFWNKCHLQIL